MTLVKKGEKRKAIAVGREVYDRAKEFADREGYTIGSVLDTALEDFLDLAEQDDGEKGGK